MGLGGYTPSVQFAGDLADLLTERVISWKLVDKSGQRSDELTLKAYNRDLDGLPPDGAEIDFSCGYLETGLVSKGKFKISTPEPSLFPNTMSIIARPALFQVADTTAFRERKTRSFENVTLGGLFRDLVRPHGYSPRVAPDLDIIKIAHVDQSNETDMSLATRLARRFDALAKPVDNLYVLARRGQVKTITGQDVPLIRVDVPSDNYPDRVGFVNARLTRSGRTSYKGVKATWTDPDAAQEFEVSAGVEPWKKLRQSFDSQEVALQACEGELRRLERTGYGIVLSVPGDPNMVAEGLIELGDGFPSFMRGVWSADQVTSQGQSSGYRCSVDMTKPV